MPRYSSLLIFSRVGSFIFSLLMAMSAQAGTFTNASTALTAPASSSTGNYTVSFKTSAWGTHYLQEKKGSGSWVNITSFWTDASTSGVIPSTTRNVSISGRTTATYSYRIYFVAPSSSSLNSGYSNTKITVVSTYPGVPSLISTPATDDDGAFTVNWGTASGSVTNYKLEQQISGGSWNQIYSGTNTSNSLIGLADGTYKYRVQACNSIGCSSYRTAGNSTIVIRPPGIPPVITITEL